MVSGLVSPSSTSGDPNHYNAHWCAVSSATASSFTCLSLSYWSFFFRCLFECGVLLPLLSLSILKIHLFPKFLNEFLEIHQDSLTSEEHASSTSGSKRSTALPSLKTPVASPASSSLLTKSAICELFIYFFTIAPFIILVISEKCFIPFNSFGEFYFLLNFVSFSKQIFQNLELVLLHRLLHPTSKFGSSKCREKLKKNSKKS